MDNDRYTIDGQYRQIMLSARELNSENLPSRTWINEHLTFTHGYGLTLGPVNEVTPEGLPVLFIKDLPPVSGADLKITQPALYYGELSNEHVFVKTGTEEFDYPRGDDNVFARYEGKGGVPVGGFLRRLLFALRFRSTDTLFSPSLTAESRVMMHRRISDRVRKIAPFLTYDPDPYLAISDGRLVWIQDAYTTTGGYPYSAPAARGPQLHPQRGQGHDRRLPRHDRLPPARREGPDRGHDGPDLPGALPAPRGDARGPPEPAPLPAGDLRDPGRGLLHVPHDEPRGLLQQGGPVGGPGAGDG